MDKLKLYMFATEQHVLEPPPTTHPALGWVGGGGGLKIEN